MKTTKLLLLIQLVGCMLLIIIAGCTKEDPAIRVTTIQPPPPPPSVINTFEYDLDLNIPTTYKFLNNVEFCPWDCYFADQTTIDAAVAMPPYILQVGVNEETDSAATALHVNYGFTAFRLSNQLYASGPSSFNLKKAIQQGGGSFSGTIKLNSSSALRTWREDAFKALPPLTVTGTIDTTAHTVNIQIKGKIIF